MYVVTGLVGVPSSPVDRLQPLQELVLGERHVEELHRRRIGRMARASADQHRQEGPEDRCMHGSMAYNTAEDRNKENLGH